MFDQLRGNSIFSSLDLANSFFQIRVKQKDHDKLAFTVPEMGRFTFTRVPFGLASSSFIFQKMIQMCLGNLYGKDSLAYIDDLVCASSDVNENLEKLERIFSQLRLCNLMLNPQKCKFLQKELKFLGHHVNQEGVDLDSERIKVIRDYKRPQNLRDLRAFLAFVGFFRNHVKNFAHIAEPLFQILRIKKSNKVKELKLVKVEKVEKKSKKPIFYWDNACEKAFESLKASLMRPPVLRYPDFNKTFILHTDASNFAVGAQLMQEHSGKLHPVHYASKTLNAAQRRTSTFEREFFGLVWATEMFKNYLLGPKPFVAFVDQKSLVYAINEKLEFNNDKINRFKLKLCPYNMDLRYIQGDKNIADFLSRIENPNENSLVITDNDEIHSLNDNNFRINDGSLFIVTRAQQRVELEDTNKIYQDFITTHNSLNKTPHSVQMTNGQMDDNSDSNNVYFINEDLFNVRSEHRAILRKFQLNLGDIISSGNTHFCVFRKTENSQVGSETIFQFLIKLKRKFIEKKISKISILCPKIFSTPSFLFKEMIKFIFIPNLMKILIHNPGIMQIHDLNDKNEILKQCHDSLVSAHAGIRRTMNRIRQNFNWVNLKHDVTTYVNNCIKCNQNKSKRNILAPMKITSSSDQTFEKIFIDIVGPLPTSHEGFKYILTAKDDLSKFIFAIPMEDQTSESIARSLVEGVILQVGVPRMIVADNATNFNSDLMNRLNKLLGIKKINVSIYHAQSNSVERYHKDLGAYLRNYIEKDPQSWASLLKYAVFSHNTSISATTGFTPYELVYGKPPMLNSLPNSATYTYDDYASQLKFILKKNKEIAKEKEIIEKQKNKLNYDKKSYVFDLQVGDQVFMKNILIGEGRKLQIRNKGPFPISRIINEQNIEIIINNKPKSIHKNLVSKYNISR